MCFSTCEFSTLILIIVGPQNCGPGYSSTVAPALNPFIADPLKALYTVPYWSNPPFFFNFLHSGGLALTTERQTARMSKTKNGGLDQYGAEPFEQ